MTACAGTLPLQQCVPAAVGQLGHICTCAKYLVQSTPHVFLACLAIAEKYKLEMLSRLSACVPLPVKGSALPAPRVLLLPLASCAAIRPLLDVGT